jgi:hypothetical protein
LNWSRIWASLASYSGKAREFISGPKSDKVVAEPDASDPGTLILQVKELVRKREFARAKALAMPWAERWESDAASIPARGGQLLHGLGLALLAGGDTVGAMGKFKTGLEIAGSQKDWLAHTEISVSVCEVYLQIQSIDTAILLSEPSLILSSTAVLSTSGAKSQPPRFENPKLLLNLGVCCAISAKPAKSREFLALAREAFEARCDHFHLGRVFDTLARLAILEGDEVSRRRCVAAALSHKQLARDFDGMKNSMSILDEKDRFRPQAGAMP